MPGKKMPCAGCSKVMRSDNLKHHQKICKGYAKACGKGVSLPLPSVPYSKADSNGDKLIVKDASDAESDAESDESGCDDISTEEDNYWLWEKFVMSCDRGSHHIFEWLIEILPLYQWSEKDTLFQTLMHDVEYAKEKGNSLPDSFNYAVNKNKDDIVAAAVCVTDGFWAALRTKFPMPLECKWLTGDKCHCEGCFGNSLLTKVRRFVEIFYGMRIDETIQKILDDDGDSIEESVERHKDEIMERFENAGKLVEECGIVDDPNRPRFRCESDKLLG